jgi:HEAT repeat protein
VAAVVSLGQLAAGPEKAIPALSKAVEDPNQIVRLMAAQSLGQFGRMATNALPVLERACSDPDAPVSTAAGNAIKRIKEGW